MTVALSLLCRVVRRRVKAGEKPENVLADYPKLTGAQEKEIRAALRL